MRRDSQEESGELDSPLSIYFHFVAFLDLADLILELNSFVQLGAGGGNFLQNWVEIDHFFQVV